jgi:hypothetical protein
MRPNNDFKTWMYASDLTIGAGATHSIEGRSIDVSGLEYAAIQLIATGDNASSSGNVVFYLAKSGNGVTYSTGGEPLTLTLAGTTAVVSEIYQLDLTSTAALKILRVVNGDATYGLTAVNALLASVDRSV